MKRVSELKRNKERRERESREIIRFLRRNKGHGYTREEIVEETGCNPAHLTSVESVFGIEYFELEDGYYYYVFDWLKYFIFLLFCVLLGLLIGSWI